MFRKKSAAYAAAIVLILLGLGIAAFAITGLLVTSRSATTTVQHNKTVILQYSAQASLYAVTEKSLIYPNGTAKILSQGALPAKLLRRAYGVFKLELKTPPSIGIQHINYRITRQLNIGPFSVKLNETKGTLAPGARMVIGLGLREMRSTLLTLLHETGLPVTTDMSLEVRLEATTKVANKTITMDPLIKISMGYNEPIYKVTATSSQGTETITLPAPSNQYNQTRDTAATRKLLLATFSAGIVLSLSGSVLYTRARQRTPREILESLTIPVIGLKTPPRDYVEAMSIQDIARLAERTGQPLLLSREKGLACTPIARLFLCAKISTDREDNQ